MEYNNGRSILSDNYIYYEIVSKINKYTYEKFYDFLVSKKWENETELFFSFEEFKVPTLLYNKFVEDQFVKKEVKDGIYKCINRSCGSMKTVSYSRQTRSRDEGETIIVECSQCNTHWRIG